MHTLDPLHAQMGVEEVMVVQSLCSTTLPCSRRQSEKLENYLGKVILMQDVSLRPLFSAMRRTGYFQYQPSQTGLLTAGEIKISAITGQSIFPNPLGGHLRKISLLYNVFPSTEEAL